MHSQNHTNQPEPATGLFESWTATSDAHQQRRRRLWQMSAPQRVAAMYRGELSWDELQAWTNRYPDEVPLLNGEYWYIAITTPEIAEA